jgi:outer membrane protein assembly factor BamB
VGGGFSSPIVVQDRVFYLDENGSREVAHCVDAGTGQEIWKSDYAARFADEWGAGPRATPFSDGERVYVQSCDGEFRCLDFGSGKTIWGFNFESYGVKFLGNRAREGTASRRGNNGSGVLDGDAVIVPVGATNGATLVCLNKKDGTLLWKTGTDEAAYSSPMVGEIAGARQVVAFTADALLGADRISGKILWRAPLTTFAKRHAATPVINGNRVFVNSHTFGTICFEISRDGAGFKAAEKWRNAEMKINLATPVLVHGHLYSQGAGRDLVCMDAETGATRWKQEGFGDRLTTVIAAGSTLLALTDTGEAVFVRADPMRYEERQRAQICGRTWNMPAVGSGKLVVRDHREISCFGTK